MVARGISWNSVSNKLNLVEYTTHLPPAWQILASTNGNGNRLKVTDASTGDPFDFIAFAWPTNKVSLLASAKIRSEIFL